MSVAAHQSQHNSDQPGLSAGLFYSGTLMSEEKTETELKRASNVMMALTFWGLLSLAIAALILFFLEYAGIPLPAKPVLLPVLLAVSGVVTALGAFTKVGRKVADELFFSLTFWIS